MKAFWVAMVAAGMLSLGGYVFGEEAAVASTQSATAQDESVAKKTNDNTNGVAAPKECKGGDCAKKAAAQKKCKGGDCAKKAAAQKKCKGGNCAKKAAAQKKCKGGDCAKKAAAEQSKSVNQN